MGRIAIVTGANQGLGAALVKGLAHRWTSDDIVYLTARDPARGQDAVHALGRTSAKVVFAPLDVTIPSSITDFAEHLAANAHRPDIVFSNAAARMDKNTPMSAQVRNFVQTNNRGCSALFRSLLPQLNPKARYLIVASSLGRLSLLPAQLHNLFNTDVMTLDELDQVMRHYVDAVETGTASKAGWPDWINIPSKIGQVAMARIAAREMAARGSGICVNAVCPGLVDTEASRPWFEDMSQAQSPDAAAKVLLDFALSDNRTAISCGELYQFHRLLPWR